MAGGWLGYNAGMKLTPDLLLTAYARGIFPMAREDGSIAWYDPDPRAILPLEGFHIPRRLRRRINHSDFEIRVDTAFRAVMVACGERPQTWISPVLIDLYTRLHQHGFAHSVETYLAGELVGGLYGVALGGLFAGESMFSRTTDASKVALVHLVARLRAGGFCLLDTQFTTPHLARFGVVEIPRSAYQQRLAAALRVRASFFPA